MPFKWKKATLREYLYKKAEDPLYFGTTAPVKDLQPGGEGKYWATPDIAYALSYSRAPKGRSHFKVSGNRWSTQYAEGSPHKGHLYRVINPEVFRPEYGLEYTSRMKPKIEEIKDIASDLKFKTRKSLVRHFKKHGPSLAMDSPERYLASARDVIRRGLVAPAKGHKIRIFDPYTKEQTILDPELNRILTYYIRRAYLS